MTVAERFFTVTRPWTVERHVAKALRRTFAVRFARFFAMISALIVGVMLWRSGSVLAQNRVLFQGLAALSVIGAVGAFPFCGERVTDLSRGLRQMFSLRGHTPTHSFQSLIMGGLTLQLSIVGIPALFLCALRIAVARQWETALQAALQSVAVAVYLVVYGTSLTALALGARWVTAGRGRLLFLCLLLVPYLFAQLFNVPHVPGALRDLLWWAVAVGPTW